MATVLSWKYNLSVNVPTEFGLGAVALSFANCVWVHSAVGSDSWSGTCGEPKATISGGLAIMNATKKFMVCAGELGQENIDWGSTIRYIIGENGTIFNGYASPTWYYMLIASAAHRYFNINVKNYSLNAGTAIWFNSVIDNIKGFNSPNANIVVGSNNIIKN